LSDTKVIIAAPLPSAAVGTVPEPPVLLIEPPGPGIDWGIKEVWECRELLYFLTLREVKIRYKQTALGASWAILQPVFSMLVFTLFFGRLGHMPSDGVPYSLFALAGLVPWTFFANGLGQSSNSLVGNAHLLSKVYFPRLIIPIAAVASGLIDLGIGFGVLIAMMAYQGVYPTANIVWLPLFLLLALTTSLGTGLWLSALNVHYRDVRHTIPFLTQFWMFATPIVYPSSLLVEPWRTVYALNPMVGVVEGFRWTLLGVQRGPGPLVFASAVAAVALLVGGIAFFRRMESSFADVV